MEALGLRFQIQNNYSTYVRELSLQRSLSHAHGKQTERQGGGGRWRLETGSLV